METKYTQADIIAAQARDMPASQACSRQYVSCSDIDTYRTPHRLQVTAHQWDHIAKRAKTYGAKTRMQRGHNPSTGQPRMDIIVDGTVCEIERTNS